jgi:cyclopropane fatty-acyl-phospholipid synthase-like methyltransferase
MAAFAIGIATMEWFESLYDDFRQRTGFGNLPEDRTRSDVDFLVEELSLQPGNRVLDLFSGTGRHSIELARRGIEAVGVEFRPEYVSIAEQRAKEARVAPQFIMGDVRRVPFGSDYDAVIIMWMSFGYFSDDEDRAVIRKVHSSLRPGGHFFMELLNRDDLLRHFTPRDEKLLGGVKVVEERTFNVLTSRMDGTVCREDAGKTVTRETHWRLYSPHELKNILEATGFRLVAAYGGLDRKQLDLETRLMRLVFKKGCEPSGSGDA